MTRDEAHGAIADMLLEIIRSDVYPSATQMALLEEIIPTDKIPDYLEVLMEKVEDEDFPSIPMIQRIIRVAGSLPAVDRRQVEALLQQRNG